MADLAMPAASSSSPPRRVAAVGVIRQHAGRTTRIVATPHGASGTIRTTAGGGTCHHCGGAGGHIIDTSSDGITRQTWQTCRACGGTGVQR